MPKRIGYLFEKTVSFENCYLAVLEGSQSLRRTNLVKYVRENAVTYALTIQHILINGWEPGDVRTKVIKEGNRRKERHLVIPCSIIDHLIHTAIIRVIQPMLEKRFDFASCGSIKGRGPRRVDKIIRGCIYNDKYPYALECDVRKFYDNCRYDIVMKELRRFIKDEKYLHLHELILHQMRYFDISDKNKSLDEIINNAKGLAVGFSPSSWYANLVLNIVDRKIRSALSEHKNKIRTRVKFVRYVDNYVVFGRRKRNLHFIKGLIVETLNSIGLKLKGDYQIFRISNRAVSCLSYRYFKDRVLVRKGLMYKIARKARKTAKNPTGYNARSLISQIGVLRHCDSHNFFDKYIYSVISLKSCRRYISNADKKRFLLGGTA